MRGKEKPDGVKISVAEKWVDSVVSVEGHCESTDTEDGASVNLGLMDKFYLGDMLSVDEDADAAVKARIRMEWNKFEQLVPLLNSIPPTCDTETWQNMPPMAIQCGHIIGAAT